MELGFNAEQQQLADAERSWLSRHDPVSRVRTLLDGEPVSTDPDALAHAAESGLLGLLTDAIGGSHADLAVLSEIHGHAASSLPIADLAITAWLLEAADAPEAESAADGTALFGLSHRRAGRQSTGAALLATPAAGVVVLRSGGGDGDHLVIAPATVATPMSTLDLTRPWFRVGDGLDEFPRRALPPGAAALAADALSLHRAIDALGAADRLLQMTIAYAGQREQFGVPIGSFQAVKHHCADMAIAVEASRATLWRTAQNMAAESEAERSRAVAAAAAYAKAAASRVAGTALQVHGGIGFTWEHDLHLFLRRIKVDEAMNGTVAEHRDALAG
ncbi:acyl-CoA dehydrogenase, C-terminal domain protein [Mycobacterium avium subsp. avium 2285 (R)]|nr:acyl-CoA dehydrogenase, C-terminal domain protein [Mycobacterium avium subsp. avium 2285 (R)]